MLPCGQDVPAPTSVGLMSGQLRRRWPNIKPTLVQYLVFAVGCIWHHDQLSLDAPKLVCCHINVRQINSIGFTLGSAQTKLRLVGHCFPHKKNIKMFDEAPP